MKKHFLILFLIIFSFSNSFGQSKKEQIEELNYRVDSLVRILGLERSSIKQQKASLEQQIVDLNNSITKLKAQALIDKNSLKTKDEAIVKAASEKAQLSAALKEKNDSLNLVLADLEKLKPPVKKKSNPFGSGNEAGANESGGINGAGKGKSGSEDGGLGKGEGEPKKKPIINASFPLYYIDYDCYIHLLLTVNANGEVVAAKSIKSKTICTDQRIINQVINEVIRQVKYKKENGAGLVYVEYSVEIHAK